MSFQWTVIAAVLYCEIAWTVLLLLPIISAKRWRSFFESNICQSLGTYASYYFNVFMLLLGMCFLDSIREIRKYDFTEKPTSDMANQVNMNLSMKLFRAQRNFYIAGFALFMWFVLRRLVSLILLEASALDNSDDAITKSRQAQEALEAKVTELNERLIALDEERLAGGDTPEPNEREQALRTELNKTKEDLATSEQQLALAQGQTTSLKEEFDNLSAEYQGLQEKYNSIVESANGEKKEI